MLPSNGDRNGTYSSGGRRKRNTVENGSDKNIQNSEFNFDMRSSHVMSFTLVYITNMLIFKSLYMSAMYYLRMTSQDCTKSLF